MNGYVDASGRALIEIVVSGPEQRSTLSAWIDTGFTGGLALPAAVIGELSLPVDQEVETRLADGSTHRTMTYAAGVQWFGNLVRAEVVSTQVPTPLLGVQLLVGRELRVDYASMTVSVRDSP